MPIHHSFDLVHRNINEQTTPLDESEINSLFKQIFQRTHPLFVGLFVLLTSFFGCADSPDPECPVGYTYCNGACYNTQADSNHCGVCGNLCGAGLTCQAGQCVTASQRFRNHSSLTARPSGTPRPAWV